MGLCGGCSRSSAAPGPSARRVSRTDSGAARALCSHPQDSGRREAAARKRASTGDRGPGAGGSQSTTHRVQVEGAGAHEGDGAVQVVVVHAVLVVLVGDHGEGKGPHAAQAPVGQPHLQAYGVAHPAGCRLAVTRLSVHQHVCKGHRTQGGPGTAEEASPTSTCSFGFSLLRPSVRSLPHPFIHRGCHTPCARLGAGRRHVPLPHTLLVTVGGGCLWVSNPLTEFPSKHFSWKAF